MVPAEITVLTPLLLMLLLGHRLRVDGRTACRLPRAGPELPALCSAGGAWGCGGQIYLPASLTAWVMSEKGGWTRRASGWEGSRRNATGKYAPWYSERQPFLRHWTECTLGKDREWWTLTVLLYSEGSVSTSVGVIDHGVEGLVDPLPEEHRRCGPKTEWSITYRPLPET